jgi:hypothetical protein
MRLQGTLESFAIMFKPDGLHRLFSIPMHQLTDQDFEAHSVLGNFISQARQRLGNTRSFTDRVRVVDAFLLRQSLGSLGFDGISAAANRIILAGGRIDIGGLCSKSVCVPSSS